MKALRIVLPLLMAVIARAEDSVLEVPGGAVVDLCASGPGQFWAATGEGLYLVTAHRIRPKGPRDACSAVWPAGAGAVYARYEDGVAEVTETSFEWRSEPPRYVPNTAITHRGELWSASPAGIARRRLRPRFTRHPLPHTDRVHALAAAPDGSIWCATQKGVARRVGDRFEVHGEDLGLVTAVAVDTAGHVWIGSGSAFTGVRRFANGRWEAVPGIDAFVHSIGLDETGTLWFSALGNADQAAGGAWYWDGQRFRAASGLGARRVYDVAARDPAGILWFATLKGLVAVEGEDKVTNYTPESGKLRAEKVWCLHSARDGSLWLGYQQEGGATRLARGVVTNHSAADGLCDDAVWAIEEGQPGVFWFGTRGGLGRYDGRRWSCFRFTKAPLWPLLPRPDGTLWIGTIGDGGLWRFDPDDDEAPRTTMLAHKDGAVVWEATDAWFETPSDELWHRWRVGNGSWSKASPSARAEPELPPGRHVIEVQAIDALGNAEDPPARIVIEVAGPPSRALWLAALVAAIVVIGLIARRRGS
ncbi:MAG: ligand-binding sensor domain-containing protein [Planctomycetota bacterium]